MVALSLSAAPDVHAQNQTVTPVAQPIAQSVPSVGVQAAPTLSAPAPRQARPGSYVTLSFMADGQGEYDFLADGGPQWIPVSRSRRVRLSGPTLIPVTFRVPELAPVGASPPLELRVLSGEVVLGSARAQVEVLALSRLRLQSPTALKGAPGQRVTFPVEVTNLGNQTDTVQLRVTNVDERPKLSEETVTLRPGETRTVSVNLLVERASSNYRFITFVEAKSGNDPKQLARTRTETTFNAVNAQEASQAKGPQLTFAIRSTLEAGSDWSPQGRESYLNYSIQPRVTGGLSDYATADANLSGLDGSVSRPAPSGISLGLRVSAERWNVSLSASRNGLLAQGSLRRGEWKFSPRVSYVNLYGLSAFEAGLGAVGPLLGGTLGADAGTLTTNADGEQVRADHLSVNYSRALTPNLGLLLAAVASGQSNPSAYTTSMLGYQQLSYNTAAFDLTQSYSASLGGLQTLGLSGGTRSLRPFGIRAGAALTLQPGGLTYSLSGLGVYTTPGGLSASVSGRYGYGTLLGTVPAWQVTAAVNTPAVRVGRASVHGNATYTLATDQDRPGEYHKTATLATTLNSGPWQADLSGVWQQDPKSLGQAQTTLRLGLSGAYTTRRGDSLTGRYDYTRVQQQGSVSGDLVGQSVKLSWNRQWTPALSTQLGYGRSWLSSPLGNSVSDSVDVGLGWHDAFVPGLMLSSSYRLFAPQGLAQGGFTNSARIGLSYDLSRVVNTPQAIVNLFGGRIGGEVSGTLYRDANLSGQRDPDEPGLSGVTVSIGKVSAVSDAAGHYRLRVPVGTFPMSFPAGLPATVEALEEPQVQVKENSTSTQDVAFAPVSNVEVMIFNDLNRNATPDDGEPTIPYAGASLSGPVNRTVQADSRGYARFAAVPAGQYVLGLGAKHLPSGFQATGRAVNLTVRAGEHLTAQPLGAAAPARQVVNTFSGGNIAVIGTLSPRQAIPGAQVKLTLRTQNAATLQVSVFGGTVNPVVQGGFSEVLLTVPSGTLPGEYDITVTASGSDSKGTPSQKTTVLKLIVTAPGSPVGGTGRP